MAFLVFTIVKGPIDKKNSYIWFHFNPRSGPKTEHELNVNCNQVVVQ